VYKQGEAYYAVAY